MSKEPRNIVNISLPPAIAQEVKREVAEGGFASTSEFFRHLLREHRKAQLARELKAERAQINKGKGKNLRSLKDLR